MAYLADDILMMPPNEPAVVVGITAAPAGLGAFARQYRATVSYPTNRVGFAGDLAAAQYTGILPRTPIAGWPPMTEVLKGLHVDRRARR